MWRTISGGGQAVLRLGLRSNDAPLRQSLIHLVVLGLVVLLAWVLVLLQERLRRRLARAEEENKRVEKLAALGEMAAVLAHEIRNPLGGIKGHTQLVLEDMADDEPNHRALSTAVQEVVRLEKLIQHLLFFARPQQPHPETLSLSSTVEETIALLPPAKVSFDRQIPSSFWVFVDREHLRQILLNLFKNAQEASPPGGKVLLVAREAAGEALFFVSDEGEGIAPEDEKKIFQPFFTTRVQGTGLGLAICRELAQANGGSLEVTASPQNSLEVTASPPKRQEHTTSSPEKSATAQVSPQQGATFLLRLPLGETPTDSLADS